MKDSTLNYRELLTRKPILIPLPSENRMNIETYDGHDFSEPDDTMKYQVLTQAEMLRQYYPQAHKINNPAIYPDVWKEMPVPGNPNKKRLFRQPITRTAFAFQRVLKIKQVIHVCGNDIQMELSAKESDQKKNINNAELLLDLREGWLEMGMEERWFEAIDSIKTVSDAAVVFYFDDDGSPKTKTLSFLNGDKLYPHYDSISGKLKFFARKYRDYDEDGRLTTEWVEVWDDKYLYRAKREISNFKPIRKLQTYLAPDNPNNPFAPFAMTGYRLVGEPKEHGFDFVPVC
ncbi:MAG: phage portal protein, partial [Prevotella sp.]|nr:phage portal protein [Prevotella sp.]